MWIALGAAALYVYNMNTDGLGRSLTQHEKAKNEIINQGVSATVQHNHERQTDAPKPLEYDDMNDLAETVAQRKFMQEDTGRKIFGNREAFEQAGMRNAGEAKVLLNDNETDM